MLPPMITRIEQAMVEAIKKALPYIKQCETMNSTLRGEVEKDTNMYPAAFVLYTTGRNSYYTAGAQEKACIFSVLVSVKNFQGEERARHGDNTDKGAYEILRDLDAALTNNKVGLEEIDPLFAMDEGALAGNKSNAIYYINFETKFLKTY